MFSNKIENIKDNISLIIVIVIFGTVGVTTQFVPLSPVAISFYRACLASVFILLVCFFKKKKIDFNAIRKNIVPLSIATFALATNWILQFIAFKMTSVSASTVCYNCMPIFLIILAPLMFKEKITTKSIMCVLMALIGVILVSDVINVGLKSSDFLGCGFALLGAFFYALVVAFTKKIEGLDTYDKILFEFSVSAFAILIYGIITKDSFVFIDGSNKIVGLLALLHIGINITGISYIIYFSVVQRVKAQSVAIYTYIDPLVALLLSSIVLHERLSVFQIVGSILILLATLMKLF